MKAFLKIKFPQRFYFPNAIPYLLHNSLYVNKWQSYFLLHKSSVSIEHQVLAIITLMQKILNLIFTSSFISVVQNSIRNKLNEIFIASVFCGISREIQQSISQLVIAFKVELEDLQIYIHLIIDLEFFNTPVSPYNYFMQIQKFQNIQSNGSSKGRKRTDILVASFAII